MIPDIKIEKNSFLLPCGVPPDDRSRGLWESNKEKLFADIGYQWRPTGKKFTLGKLDYGYQWRPTGKKFALGEMMFKTFEGMFKDHEFCGKVIGYGQIGDMITSELSWVYGVYVLSDSVGLNKTVRFIRTDNGTEFVNQVMSEYYECVGIFHQKSILRTPQQNGVVERRNCTLVEAAHTMMIFQIAPMFLWAEDVAMLPKVTFGFSLGLLPSRRAIRIYNKRTRRLMETIHVIFDEMDQKMAPVRMIKASVLPPGTSLSTIMAQDATENQFGTVHHLGKLIRGTQPSYQPPDHSEDGQRSSLDNIVGNPSHPVFYQKNS
ncbi:retrovirus-related pol polyprotein from transposon TNT 1-94 [Tanacetum coccineum]